MRYFGSKRPILQGGHCYIVWFCFWLQLGVERFEKFLLSVERVPFRKGFPVCQYSLLQKGTVLVPESLKLGDSGTTTKYSKWRYSPDKSVDFPSWGLLIFAGHTVICTIKRKFPVPGMEEIIAESCSGLFV